MHHARPTYEELRYALADLATQKRALEALLAAERDRAETQREKREVAEERRALAERQLEELRKSYRILQQEHELLRRRIHEARASARTRRSS